MSPLNNEQKQLLFDYCICLTSQKEKAEAEALISSSKEADEIHSKITNAIKPLDILENEPCPDELAESTIQQLNNIADSNRNKLQKLLAKEQNKNVTVKIGLWRNWSELAAVAAAILLIAGVLVPTLGVARQKYQQKQCKTQIGSIFKGLSNYIMDYDGKTPAVATVEGAPWWKVGDQGSENQSNTRHLYLLVKCDYVKLIDFSCPGSKKSKLSKITSSQIKVFKDFPDSELIDYSFQINCNNTSKSNLHCRRVLMADRNPLFEKLPKDLSRQFKLLLDRELLTLNSINHNRHGQNVLFGDGRVEFIKTRSTGIAKDDIFTLQDTDVYRGCEVPSCQTDFFLAP